jgi:hypothetical protein
VSVGGFRRAFLFLLQQGKRKNVQYSQSQKFVIIKLKKITTNC